MATIHQANRKSNLLTAQLGATGTDDDDNNASQLLLSQDKIPDFLMGVQLLNLVCESPKSNSCSNSPTNRRPPAVNNNDDKDDVEQPVFFDLSCYPDGANGSIYIFPSSHPPRTRTHDSKYQEKKLGQHSCQTKPNKLNLI